MYTGMYREATTNEVRAGDRVAIAAHPVTSRCRTDDRSGAVGHAPPGRRSPGSRRVHVRLEDALAHQRTSPDEHPVDVGGVHAPHDRPDRVVDREDVRAVGPQHDDVGLHARLERPGHPTQPRHPGAVDRGEADHVARAHQLRAAPALPGQLAIEDRGVLQRDRRPHLGEHVAGRHPLVVDPQSRAGYRGRSAAGSGRPEAAGHLARRRQRRPRLPTPRWRRYPRRRGREPWTSVTSVTEEPPLGRARRSRPARRLRDRRGRGCAGPSSRAAAHRRAAPGRARPPGRTDSEGDRASTGRRRLAMSARRPGALAVARRPRAADEHGAQRRRRRGPGARRRRSRRPPPRPTSRRPW